METGNAMRNRIPIVLAAALAGALLASQFAPRAQPIRDRVLHAIRITEDTDCAVIEVRFNIPVRYITHFPAATGSDLRIRLRPINVSRLDRSALTERESGRVPRNQFAALTEVIYEGDNPVGPYLNLRFRRPVTYSVGQGDDFRSLLIAVVGPEPSDDCSPHS